MTRKSIIITAAFVALCGTALAQVRLLRSGEREALISCEFAPVSFSSNDQGQKIAFMADCQVEGEPGQPANSYRQILVGVPVNAKVEVKMSSGDYEDHTEIDLAPVPFIVGKGPNDLGTFVYRKTGKYYQTKGLFPQSTALLHAVDMIRGHQVAWVRLNPTQYDPVAKKLRVYSKIVVQVTWDIPGKPGAKTDDDVYGPILAEQVINYQQSKSWMAEPPKTRTKSADPFAVAPVWYKLSVVSQGIYRLDYNYLKRNGINPDIIDPRTLKLFNGGSRAFSKNYAPSDADSLKQMSIRVTGEQDGRFDAGDRIFFFGQSLAGWDKNSALPNHLFYNPYGDTNCYWLCWGGAQGLRMADRDCRPLSSDYVIPQSFSDTLHFEQEAFNPFNSGELWYWLSLKRMPGEAYHDYSLPFDLSFAMPGPAAVRINYLAGTNSRHHLNWGLNGTLSRQNIWSGNPSSGPRTDSLTLPGLPAASNVLNLQLDRSSADTMDLAYLNWFEVIYRRNYQAYGCNLRFRADSLAGQTYRFRLTGFASDSLLILDISNPERPVEVKSDRIFRSYAEFDDPWQKGRLYWAAGEQGWQRPAKIEPYVPQNLRQSYQTVNYLVVTADEFWPQAQALLAVHADEPRLQPAAAVKLSWIYNEFSYGLKDPSAIRRYLDHLFVASGGDSPKSCLLFGDGSYDYRDIDRTWGRHDFIPTHQGDNLDFNDYDDYFFPTFDDWYAYSDSSSMPQFILARIPAKNAAEAWTVINKSSRYRARTGDAQWRNRAILVADDEFVAGGAREPGGEIHTSYSEGLYPDIIPNSYEVIKVYGAMHEYPLYSGYKPDARNALIGYWNDGAGIINYFGHGSYWVWGHEWYFRDTDVSNLANGDKLPLVVMGTCGTTKFDMNRYESIGTSLVVKNGGGAIATVGATRGTGPGGNNSLVRGIYNGIFNHANDIGQAVFSSKLSAEHSLYILMGDPALYLTQPAGTCSLSLNADTLKSRGIYSVSGKITGLPGPLNGQALLTLFNPSREDSSLFTPRLKYQVPGRPILKFGALVQNDSLNAGFILPNMSSVNTETLSGARLSVYAWGSGSDASGILGNSLWIGGEAAPDTSVHDVAKPSIEVWANDLKLTDGDLLGVSTPLTIKISDDRGLNIIPFSASPTNQAQLFVDNNILYNLSNDFVFDIGSAVAGRTTWSVVSDSGNHKFRFSVYDLTGKKGVLDLNLRVQTATGENKIDNVYNYPNPFRQGTCFTFNLYQAGDVTIKIYTIGGRMIKALSQAGRSFGYNQLYWDGRDAEGSILANGVYFYKITVKGLSGEASQIGKMVVMK